MKLRAFLEEYSKHSALNLGQVVHGIAHFGSHPDLDDIATRGTVKHFALSATLRSKRLLNDVFFTVIPPHWHHSSAELRVMRTVSMRRWFTYGFAAWRFTESGALRSDLSNADPRWDPRCNQKPTAAGQ